MANLISNYSRADQQRALRRQADTQAKLLEEYNKNKLDLQKQLGQAVGNDELTAELNNKLAELDRNYQNDLYNTADLTQYIKDSKPLDDSETNNKVLASNALTNYVASKMGVVGKAPNTEHLQRQAEMHDKQAGDEQKNAQQNFQVANRNYRGEAEKNAVSQAASENAQKLANLGNASAGAAALERGVKSADYNTHMQRQDQQRAEGVKNQREMWGSKQTAEEERANADKEQHDYLDTQLYNNMSDALSAGGGSGSFSNSNTTSDNNEETTTTTETTTTESTEEAPEDEGIVTSGNLHVLMNYIQGSSKDADKYNTPEIQELIKKYGVQPLPPEKQTFNHAADQEVARLYPEFMADYNRLTGRGVATANQQDAKSQADVERYRNMAELTDSNTVSEKPKKVNTLNSPAAKAGATAVVSDSNVKNIISTLSGIRF